MNTWIQQKISLGTEYLCAKYFHRYHSINQRPPNVVNYLLPLGRVNWGSEFIDGNPSDVVNSDRMHQLHWYDWIEIKIEFN